MSNGTFYDLAAKTIDGKTKSMSDFRGKVLLIVNVASRCGFTSQYDGLQKLQEKFKDKGFEVLGFPCNQFGNQEPGNNEEISNFCTLTYKISFPMFAKIDVNGEKAHPIFTYLKHSKKGVLGTDAIKWNFTKFLVSKDGAVIERYSPQKPPEEIGPDIEKAFGK